MGRARARISLGAFPHSNTLGCTITRALSRPRRFKVKEKNKKTKKHKGQQPILFVLTRITLPPVVARTTTHPKLKQLSHIKHHGTPPPTPFNAASFCTIVERKLLSPWYLKNRRLFPTYYAPGRGESFAGNRSKSLLKDRIKELLTQTKKEQDGGKPPSNLDRPI